MAKSFKQLSTDVTQSVKPTSEKDILDFLEQDWLIPAVPVEQKITVESNNTGKKGAFNRQKQVGNKSNSSNISNPGNTSNISNSTIEVPSQVPTTVKRRGTTLREVDLKENTPHSTRKAPAAKTSKNITSVVDDTEVNNVTDVTPEHDVDVRQTFVLGQQYLEGLKNYVHTKRMSGQYDFTQKQALHQALDLLFATAQIEERPLQIRQKEEVRRQQIRKGKLK